MKVDYFDIGKRIRKERVKLGFTIEELAEALNLSSSYMGLIERGQRGVSIETLCKLSTIFGVSTDYLIYPDETLNKNEQLLIGNHLHRKLYDLTKNYSNRDLEFLIEFIKLKEQYDL